MKNYLKYSGLLAVAGFFVAIICALNWSDVDANRGRMTQGGYVFTNPPVPATFLRADEQGFVAYKTTSADGGLGAERLPGWKHAGAYNIDTALGGMGETRYRLHAQHLIVSNDAGTGNFTPLQLKTFAGGNIPLVTTALTTYYITAMASNGTDYATWRVSGAVKNSGGTITAVGADNAVGTEIAPTANTAGALSWRIKPNTSTGYLTWTLKAQARDGGGSLPGDVVWYVEEVTLP